MNEKNIDENSSKSEEIQSHLLQYGFLNKSNEIYNGFSKSWDLGINGSVLKNKIKNCWIDFFVTSEEKNFLIDTPILTHEKVLEASGHKENFSDWVVKCKVCKRSFRIDKIIGGKENKDFLLSNKEKKKKYFQEKKCNFCGGYFEEPNQFNLMLKTSIAHEEEKGGNQVVYLRPETCQGIFINFKNLINTTKKSLPFGIGQIGKSFRNEVTLNHGIFRTREFEQAELEFFLDENKDYWWNYWVEKSKRFFNKIISGRYELASWEELKKEELPHYANKTIDLHFKYQFGWGEICSISDRGDYDLKNHSEKSSVFLGTKRGSFPHVIEVSFGIERMMLAVIESSYKEELVQKSGLKRTFLSINPLLSPYFVSVMPLSSQLKEKSKKLYREILSMNIFSVSYEETGNIGNRYRRQDSIGTKFCVTIDFGTEMTNEVTVRERDSMKQEKINLDNLKEKLTSCFLEEKRNLIIH